MKIFFWGIFVTVPHEYDDTEDYPYYSNINYPTYVLPQPSYGAVQDLTPYNELSDDFDNPDKYFHKRSPLKKQDKSSTPTPKEAAEKADTSNKAEKKAKAENAEKTEKSKKEADNQKSKTVKLETKTEKPKNEAQFSTTNQPSTEKNQKLVTEKPKL